jgi:hypothetical protein
MNDLSKIPFHPKWISKNNTKEKEIIKVPIETNLSSREYSNALRHLDYLNNNLKLYYQKNNNILPKK